MVLADLDGLGDGLDLVRCCCRLIGRGRLTERSQNPGFYSNVETTDQQDNY